jgi:diacylglycerol kinase family enzyme
VIVLLNSTSGATGRDDQLSREMQEAVRRHELKAEVWHAESGSELAALARRAAQSDSRTVVAGGGDGTINAVAAALLGSDKRLGVLPLGTLNHFAKDLGVPLELDAAVRNLITGREAVVDVGEVNGRVFLNNSSLGLYPRIVRHRDQQRHQLGRGKWPAFAWALLSAMHVCPTLRLRLQANGSERVARTPFLFIGNNAYSMDMLRIGARERLDQGALSVYYARGAGRLGVFTLALRSLLGRVAQAGNFETFTAQELRVETRRRSVDVSTDGEVTRLESPLIYRIHPRALRVLVPANSESSA